MTNFTSPLPHFPLPIGREGREGNEMGKKREKKGSFGEVLGKLGETAATVQQVFSGCSPSVRRILAKQPFSNVHPALYPTDGNKRATGAKKRPPWAFLRPRNICMKKKTKTRVALDALEEAVKLQKLQSPEIRFKGFWNSRHAEPSPCITIFKRNTQTKE